MKRSLIVLLLILMTVMVLSGTAGVMVGKEFGGRDRYYIGAQVTLGETIGLGLDVYYPVVALEKLAKDISNIHTIELDPGILLSLELPDTKIYAFVSPMIVLNVQSLDYSIVPIDILRGKVGIRLKVGALSIFVEGITAFQYSPFAMSDIYGIHGGISSGF